MAKAEELTCNRCRFSWEASKAKTCPECDSFNIELGKGRPLTEALFKAGDWVRFRGLKHGIKIFPPFYGKLAIRKNTVKGAVKIEGEPLGLIFNPDGTLYCHAYLGILLDKAKPLPKLGGEDEGKTIGQKRRK